MRWRISCDAHDVGKAVIRRQTAGTAGIAGQTVRVGRASASGIGRLFSGIGATCCFSNISVSPLTESMCMARHLGHCERGGADSSRKTSLTAAMWRK